MELQIRDVSKTYPNGVQALKDVTLTIPAGMYGLLGPNGAGKSTLMRILATLQEPDDGSIRLGDIDVLNQKDEVRKTLGYLPQEFGVYPKVSAEELLDHFALLKGIAERRARKEVVEALLRQTNLWDVRKQKLGGYSGGMRQRFGVAVALLGNPKLMIVDEPTAGLDPAERVRFLNLLSELGENSVVLLSTHIVEDVSELCTRMAIIDRGEILLEAEPLRAVDDLRGRIWRRVISKQRARRAGARARGDLDEAPRRAHRRARLQRRGARPRLRARRAGPRGRLLQHDGGAHRPAPRAAGAGGGAMKLWGIFRFELAYQVRRAWPWLYLRRPARVRVPDDERQRPRRRAVRGLLRQLAIRHRDSHGVRRPDLASGGRGRRRRSGGAGRGDGHASAHLHRSRQQGRVPRRAIPRRPRAQRVDPARRAGGHPARPSTRPAWMPE